MQASQAKNETRLPRAVLRRSEAIQADIDARKAATEPKTDPAEVTAPVDPSQATAAPAETKSTPTADPRENDPAYWKQRFKVTAGVLEAERNDRKAQVVEFNRRLTEMQEQIVKLQATAPKTPTDLGKYFTPEQVEEIGEETCLAHVTAIEKAVKEQLSGLVEQEIKPLRDQRKEQDEAALQERKAQFLDKLIELCPDYAEIDVPGTGFHEWLAEPNDDGIVRQKILDTHVMAFNATQVARVFKAFMKTKEVPTPPVAPHGKGASGSPTVSGPVLTAPTDAEIRDFFKRSSLNKVSDRERVEFDARMKLRAG